MLQKSDNILMDRFLQDVQKLELKFPLARIVEKTGEDKGNVSKYLRGKLVPSTNFLKKFYQSFELPFPPEMQYTLIPSRNGLSEETQKLISSQTETISALKETIEILRNEITRLKRKAKEK